MTKTTTLPHFHFQAKTPFHVVLFVSNQGHGKEHLAHVSCKMHETISFGLGSKIEDHPDAQTRHATTIICIIMHQATKSLFYDPNGPKHISKHIRSIMEVNLGEKTSHIWKFDPMWKVGFLPKWQKDKTNIALIQALCCTYLMLRTKENWYGVQTRSEQCHTCLPKLNIEHA